jgi:sulfotransferase family protein
MLDRGPELAIPDESYFIPQIAQRHRGHIDVDAFVDDLRRLPALRDWGLPAELVRPRLRPGATVADGIAAVYEAYAEQHGKVRWGDKTPMYMQHLGLLESLFPEALYVHLIRDGRDAALSFLAVPEGIMTETWGHPRDAAGFARQWRTEVIFARELGRKAGPKRYLEVRYEELVAKPELELRRICSFAGLRFDPAMLDYARAVDVSSKPHQQSLRRPPTPGLRDWRGQLPGSDVVAFERIAGDLLAEVGYELVTRDPAPPDRWTRAGIVSYRLRTSAWRTAGHTVRRLPLWRRRHPYLE